LRTQRTPSIPPISKDPKIPKANYIPRNILQRDRESGQSRLTSVFILANGHNYRVSLTIGLSLHDLRPTIAVMDTGAAPSVIRTNMLPSDWRSLGAIQEVVPRGIQDAKSKSTPSLATVRLKSKLGNLVAPADFLVVDTLAVPDILGCDFINQFVTSINPKEGYMQLDGGPRAYLLYHASRYPTNDINNLQVSRYTTLPPY
jgi:Retroviral aspartyl protease